MARALCGVPTERNPPTHPYPGLHPGLVCRAPLGHPLESSTALSRLVEALLSAVWGQACVGKLRGGQVLGAGCWEGQAAGRDRLLGGTGCCGRTPNVLGTPCCLGTGCVCEMDRFWGQAAGRTPNVLGTGCWEDAKSIRDRLLGIGRPFVEITSAGTRCSPEIALCGGRCGVASRGVGGWETAGPGLT